MSIIENSTLAELVKENYRVVSVLEGYRLDYCCRGKRTLETACKEQGLDPIQVGLKLKEILVEEHATEAGEPWFENGMLRFSTLLDHIETKHHQYVKNEIPVINALLERVAGKHGGRHPELNEMKERFFILGSDLLFHLQKEENVLFPSIRRYEQSVLNETAEAFPPPKISLEPVAVMEEEHEAAGTAMDSIRILSNHFTAPADACTSYRILFQSLADFEADLHRHVHLENNVLFPAVAELAG